MRLAIIDDEGVVHALNADDEELQRWIDAPGDSQLNVIAPYVMGLIVGTFLRIKDQVDGDR